MKSNVKLWQPKHGKGYFLEVNDGITDYRWAITEEELRLIYLVTRSEVVKLEDK